MSPPAGVVDGLLAGRPGQRRAVRVTALVLGLLAVALGVRDAAREDAGPRVDVTERRPVSSAPPGSAPSGPATVVQPQDAPAEGDRGEDPTRGPKGPG